ncbi:MAG: amidoligase family protein [Agathobaculum butyriciproducens]|nr:amidoligase family protein [Agathobaculum butyriciproducens]
MKEKFTCIHCGHEFLVEDAVYCSDDLMCPSCADELTVTCRNCGERVYLDDSYGEDGMRICPSCFENYFVTCDRCGRLVREEYACYADDDEDECYPLCDVCAHIRNQNALHRYDYKPEPIFYGSGLRHFGVELEIDDAGQSSKNAKQIIAVANQEHEHLYAKTDGSLDNGLELVTHPMTLEYQMNDMPWAEVLSEARSLGYLSHKACTCGLHVHISRKAFGITDEEQEAAIARLVYFVEHFWTEILRFSRRTQGQADRWAARYGAKLTPSDTKKHLKGMHAGRYMAVNLTNYSTVEIRIFRGTLKLNTLLATLQFVNHLCDIAVYLSDSELEALSWHDFLNAVHEPELIQYLKERNLYKNDPVSAEEDD